MSEGTRRGEELVACPNCTCTIFAGLVSLTSYVRRKGRVVGFYGGQRCSCQSCGHVFSIGPAGTFAHSPAALPQIEAPQRLEPPLAMVPRTEAPERNWRTEQGLRRRDPLPPREAPPV
jgi:hypothetical protein